MTHPAKFLDLPPAYRKILNEAQDHKAIKRYHTHFSFPFPPPFNDFRVPAGAKHAAQKSGRAKALAPTTIHLLLPWAVARLSPNFP